MSVLWKYLKPQRWLIVVALILAGISELLNLVDPLIFGKIIDDYALNPGNSPEEVLVKGVLFWLSVAVSVAVLAQVTATFQDYFTRLAVQKFGMQIFNDGLQQTLRLSYNEYEEQRSGEMLAVLQDVRADTQTFINLFINVVFSSVVGICFLIVYSITMNWMLFPVFVTGIVVLGTLTGLLSKEIKVTQRSINLQTYKISGAITESLRNIELVKSLGLTYPEIRRIWDQNLKIFNLEMIKVKRIRLLTFLQGATLAVLKQSILFILLWLIFHKVLTTGELISMQFISTIIFGPLQDLGNIIISYNEVEASVKYFDELMQKPIELNVEHPVEIDELADIRFDNVVFRHKTAHYNAVDGISFEVKSGETIAFVGPSGAGKSTLVKLLLGLYSPVSGEIWFNGHASSQIRYNPLRRQIGFVAQDAQLFGGTIRENLLFVQPDATDEQIMDALHKAACDNLLAGSSQGLDTIIGEGGMNLSGGEKQRISIARALLRHPRLLIFDEATSALDSLTEEDITNTIRNISTSRDQISLLIAHRLSTIMHADVIYVLEQGRIVETGSHASLLDQKGLYYAMWRQQVGERRNPVNRA
ncbi:MAG: ABC transporter ATP-binding protein [Methanoregula sp.]|jgi:ATP-binding cassette subfamily B protein|uniref:ABC transporter ATP-binding protein n=1 Tax=Methanoregula sp. TaxID=2052170 RepID=UPI003C78D919